MTGRLDAKRALVTGAGAGIGEGIARAFGAEGAEVLVTDVDFSAAKKVADSLCQGGCNARAFELDVMDASAIQELSARVAEDVGCLDVLVCNAGGTLTKYPRVLEADLAYWEDMVNLNLRSVFLSCRSFFPLMESGGSIITVASVGALVHKSGFGVYGTLKAGVIRLTQAIAGDYAEHGIRANAICPGTIATSAISRMLAATNNGAGGTSPIADAIPIGRLGKPADIGQMAVFLASAESSYVTGTVQVVDGGASLGVAR